MRLVLPGLAAVRAVPLVAPLVIRRDGVELLVMCLRPHPEIRGKGGILRGFNMVENQQQMGSSMILDQKW